jgi:hypothetical protein
MSDKKILDFVELHPTLAIVLATGLFLLMGLNFGG